MTGGAASVSGYGALLRRYRSASGLTQEELAVRSGLSVRAIADMERGRTRRPYHGSVRSLADALALPGPERDELVRAARPGAAGGGPRPAAPRQLPPAVPHFAGRSDELKALTGLLDAAAGADSTLLIAAISGTAGIGKTTLALHWAHQVAGQFTDGQLYVDLRGFDPSGEPMPPAEASRGFLDALGVPADQVPADPRDRTGLYRSLLARRRMLIVLDNARDAAQVRPLLPGSPACAVVVTSRTQLAGLMAADGARLLDLDVLSPADSREMLTQMVGAARVAAEPTAAAELIRLCARLPLALAVAAARTAASPALTLEQLTGEMRVAAGALDAMDTGEAVTSLRAAFSWSYQDLSPPAARMFRLLGVHRGPDITAAAAASLTGRPAGQSRAVLRELVRCHLVTEHPQGRFAFHDMLRAYAAELAAGQDSEAERRAAIRRMLDHYLHTARAAALVLFPHHDMLVPDPPEPGVAPEQIAGYEQAMGWFEAEHRVLLAVIAQAAATGLETYASQLPSALTVFFDRRGYWDDYASTQQTALAASLRRADLAGQARAHRALGHARTRLGAYAEACAHYQHAVELYRRLGERYGQARVYSGLAFVFEQQGGYAEALAHCERALELFRAIGDRPRQANTLNNIGWCHAKTGSYQQALERCHQALALYQELSDRHGQAATWDSLGYAHHHLADYAQAATCYQKAASLFGEYGDLHARAVTLGHLGDTRLSAGQPDLAGAAWQQALGLLDELHHSGAEALQAKLSQLGADREPASRNRDRTGRSGRPARPTRGLADGGVRRPDLLRLK